MELEEYVSDSWLGTGLTVGAARESTAVRTLSSRCADRYESMLHQINITYSYFATSLTNLPPSDNLKQIAFW